MKVLQGKQVTFDRFFPATTYFGGGYSHIDYLDIKSTSQVYLTGQFKGESQNFSQVCRLRNNLLQTQPL